MAGWWYQLLMVPMVSALFIGAMMLLPDWQYTKAVFTRILDTASSWAAVLTWGSANWDRCLIHTAWSHDSTHAPRYEPNSKQVASCLFSCVSICTALVCLEPAQMIECYGWSMRITSWLHFETLQGGRKIEIQK